MKNVTLTIIIMSLISALFLVHAKDQTSPMAKTPPAHNNKHSNIYKIQEDGEIIPVK